MIHYKVEHTWCLYSKHRVFYTELIEFLFLTPTHTIDVLKCINFDGFMYARNPLTTLRPAKQHLNAIDMTRVKAPQQCGFNSVFRKSRPLKRFSEIDKWLNVNVVLEGNADIKNLVKNLISRQ